MPNYSKTKYFTLCSVLARAFARALIHFISASMSHVLHYSFAIVVVCWWLWQVFALLKHEKFKSDRPCTKPLTTNCFAAKRHFFFAELRIVCSKIPKIKINKSSSESSRMFYMICRSIVCANMFYISGFSNIVVDGKCFSKNQIERTLTMTWIRYIHLCSWYIMSTSSSSFSQIVRRCKFNSSLFSFFIIADEIRKCRHVGSSQNRLKCI